VSKPYLRVYSTFSANAPITAHWLASGMGYVIAMQRHRYRQRHR
jgi:hypothetical protein